MSEIKRKRPWLNTVELKQEEWELDVSRTGVLKELKRGIITYAEVAKTDSRDITLFLNIVDELNSYCTLLKRLSKRLIDVKEEIKEREDEDNITTAD